MTRQIKFAALLTIMTLALGGLARAQWDDDDDDYYQRGNGAQARQSGYQDGASVAREDAARGKPYNPRPRGRYDDEDHGYSSAYGNKGAYKTQYANGYRAGYESARGRY